MSNGAPLCMACAHLHQSTVAFTCTAFPKGIPEKIVTGEADHHTPVAGDHGIVFEQDQESAFVAEGVTVALATKEPDQHLSILRSLTEAITALPDKLAGLFGAQQQKAHPFALDKEVTYDEAGRAVRVTERVVPLTIERTIEHSPQSGRVAKVTERVFSEDDDQSA